MVKIVFMGTPDFAVPVLRSLSEKGYNVVLVVTQPDRPKGRKQTLTPPPIKVEGERLHIPIFQPEKIKHEEEWKQVAVVKPDLIVTAAFGQILPQELLDVPRYGCVNVHASLLPKYRGGAPIHQSIIDGEEQTGVTIMYMVKQLDAGAILTQRSIPILEEDTTGTMHDKLSQIGADLLMETLPLIQEEKLNPQEQEEAKVTFAPTIKKEQEVIDWQQSAKQIFNQIRGLNPWPVAFTTVEDRRLKIWEARVKAGKTDKQPGSVIGLTENEILVACGEKSILALLKIQPSGKKPLDVATFLRGAGGKWTTETMLGAKDNE
ncbi:methionyl-tRNA formyltransferase [Salipaludibacillus neizhouensis]|uniref:Methionyl-tRNA formyltransferase n=1 Tax=Salipaludibacillus neizhouensis TaxID=885475 RepID=A0A3A9KM42_9BACI|nr:methionyl-tRNA formyltransferase [Salipaludibacillus neizhouensis]RKL68945.1 methionyl-tRNA formyltransferase [Salipaludibacillus neizhouensis]